MKYSIFAALIFSFGLFLLPSNMSGQIKEAIKDPDAMLALSCDDGYVYIAENNGSFAVMDSNYQQLTPFKYDKIDILNEGMLKARYSGKKALINCAGRQITDDDIVDYKVYYGDDLKHRYFVRNMSGKIGVIDREGNILVPLLYEFIDPVVAHKYLFAQGDGMTHYYNYRGQRIKKNGELIDDGANGIN